MVVPGSRIYFIIAVTCVVTASTAVAETTVTLTKSEKPHPAENLQRLNYKISHFPHPQQLPSAPGHGHSSYSSNSYTDINSKGKQPATYFQQDWTRDSYTDVAKELGYSDYQSQTYAPNPSSSYSNYVQSGEDSSFEEALSGFGGLSGLAGLIGLKGIKGLGIIGFLKTAALPFLLFVIPALLILPILLLFFPFPIISFGVGREKQMLPSSRYIFGYEMQDIKGKISSVSRSILDSDEKCIERISCEISRYSHGTLLDRTVRRMINKLESVLPKSVKRMARAYMEPLMETCERYECSIMDDYDCRGVSSTSKSHGKLKKV